MSLMSREKNTRSRRATQRTALIESVFLQPWYVPRKTACAIRNILPTWHSRKMRWYFIDYGCLRCGKKKVAYGSNGFCGRCKDKVMHQMLFTIRRHFKGLNLTADRDPTGMQSIAEARELLKDLVDKSQPRFKAEWPKMLMVTKNKINRPRDFR